MSLSRLPIQTNARCADRKRSPLAAIAFAIAAPLGIAIWLALALPSEPELMAAPPAVAERLDRIQLEKRAEAALARWQQDGGSPDEYDEGATADSVQPAVARDGLYTAATMRPDNGGGVIFEVRVIRMIGGVGSGTQSRIGCGTAPTALRITPMVKFEAWRWSSVSPASRQSWPLGAAPALGCSCLGLATNTWNCRK